ncbi:MAG: cysteine desulfurase [Planctomycetes bacterium]|nr:cysteine desulfurase [Planctomycetota bacterium]
MRTIYLDYNATTPIAPSVQQAMLPFLSEHFGNPSSSHVLGRAAHEALEDARSQLALLIKADREEIVFTAGGTESNNLAMKGTLMRRAPAAGGHLIISAIEHPSVLEPARFLERLGYDLTIVGVDGQGIVDLDAIRLAIRPDTVMVSVMHANNEIGSVQPVSEIANICHERDVLLHTDASQSVGKIRTAVDELQVDFLTIAGHKMYAPKGVGALYIRRGLGLEPVLHGAGHEGGLRAGTENVASIVGLGRAAALASKSMDQASQRMELLRDRLHNQLRAGVGSGLFLHGCRAARLPNTLSVSFPGVTGGAMLARLPELCASTGSACHSATAHMSPTLAAIGLAPEVAAGTIRLSVGWYTSEEDIDRAASALLSAWDGLRS